MNSCVLPDSRLRDHDFGNVVVEDWPCFDEMGRPSRIRLTLQPIFCCNCARPNGYVPKDLMSWVSWMCQPCAEKHGAYAALLPHPDQDFWDKVGQEMLARYGRALSPAELDALAAQDRLSNGLKLLERESPYRKMMPS